MAEGDVTVKDKIWQLNQARALVLQDPTYYPDILNGILPIIVAPSSVIELRRWGSDFLAETFSSPLLAVQKKQELALTCLTPLMTLLGEMETGILKNVIQCSSSIYPLIFRYICHNKTETAIWQQMVAIKGKILSMLDTGAEGVRLACIKFVQRIILVQTPGASDPRLADKSEVSLTIVPLNHPILNIHALEAEAHGLLDRILNVFQDDKLDAPAVSAILNCLPALVKGRAAISNKILNVLMAYNPLVIASKSTVFKERFIARSLEKTVRMTLTHLARASSQGPHSAKIHQQIQKLLQAKSEFSIEVPKSNKRVLTGTDADSHKRAKYAKNNDDSDYTPTPPPPPIQVQPSNGTTYKTLFTLTGDQALSNFDVTMLPVDMASQIVIATLFSLQQPTLDAGISAIRQRLSSLVQAAVQAVPPRPPPPPPQLDDDDDDYTPGGAGEDISIPRATTQTDGVAYDEDSDDSYEVKDLVPTTAQGKSAAMELVKMPLLSQEEIKEACEGTLERMFDAIGTLDKPAKKERAHVNRLAGTSWDRDGWVTVLSRLGTRGLSGIDAEIQAVAKSDRMHYETFSSQIRQKLYMYVLGDFRTRMDAAVSWLNEEWYNDKLQAMAAKKNGEEVVVDPQYPKWMTKVMDGIFPYLETSDRNIFLRFLSELPAIPPQVLANIRGLCLDPERSNLGFLAFQ
ncbi:Symplekin [Dactylella cylindrospora]|nr:Symplekin [Dactylella cylindrospora]